MCAMMALIAPKELGIRPKRVIRFVDAYLGGHLVHISVFLSPNIQSDLLTRSNLFSSCAYIRKVVEAEEIRNHSKVCSSLITYRFLLTIHSRNSSKPPFILSVGNAASPWSLQLALRPSGSWSKEGLRTVRTANPPALPVLYGKPTYLMSSVILICDIL